MAEKDVHIEILDTTLCDGSQFDGANHTLEDRQEIVRRLDDLGVDFIELWALQPGIMTRQVDKELFQWVKSQSLRAQVVTLGLLPREERAPEKDLGLRTLLAGENLWLAAVGKASAANIKKVLDLEPNRYMELMAKSVAFLKARGKKVIFVAEQLFQGHQLDKEFCENLLVAVLQAGADRLVLADTNGGALPHEVEETVRAIGSRLKRTGKPYVLGFHGHNDGELAVANTLAAVRAGATHVQGTINGVGEKCGNANLVSVAANLVLKMNCRVLRPGSLEKLTEVSRLVDEKMNVDPRRTRPFVGESAFTHQGGAVFTEMRKDPTLYESVEPRSVGNRRNLLLPDFSEVHFLSEKLKTMGVRCDRGETLMNLCTKLKDYEEKGWQLETADGTFVLLVLKQLNNFRPLFKAGRYSVLARGKVKTASENGHRAPEGALPQHELNGLEGEVEASVKLSLGTKEVYEVAEGNGPVHALDRALRKALDPTYPQLSDVELRDYKVWIIESQKGTAAGVRVWIRSWDKAQQRSWATVGVSHDIVAASWLALVDAFELKRYYDQQVADLGTLN